MKLEHERKLKKNKELNLVSIWYKTLFYEMASQIVNAWSISFGMFEYNQL